MPVSVAAGTRPEEASSLLDTDEELAALDPTARATMLQGMAERTARAARGEVFGPPIPIPLHGPQPGTPRTSGARTSPPPIRRRSRSPRTTHQSDHPPAPANATMESDPMDANYYVEIQVDPARPIYLRLQIRFGRACDFVEPYVPLMKKHSAINKEKAACFSTVCSLLCGPPVRRCFHGCLR